MGQADTKYIELEVKIKRARAADYTVISLDKGTINPYLSYRDEIIDKFFFGSYGKESKEHLLDLFEQVNKQLAFTLGIE